MPRIQHVVRPRPEAVGEPTTACRPLCCAYRPTPITVAPYDAALVADDIVLDVQALLSDRLSGGPSGLSRSTP
jgi:hypothetical protein